MAGVWVAQGAVAIANAQLGGSASNTPICVALFYNNPGTITPTTVLADLTLDTVYYFNPIRSGWAFSLDPTTGLVTCSQSWSFAFGSGVAGRTYYGYAFIDGNPSGASNLYYAENFAAPFTVPSGGGGYFLASQQTLGQCA